ncbi:MAG: secretin N-terminal domain-containing protein [Candidatus Eisenbacteria bacterium]
MRLTFRQSYWFTTLLSLALVAVLSHPVRAAALTRLVSIDADETYLPSVLKILAEKGDLNIITGPGVSGGKITIHMKDVPVEQAVNLVVRAAGLAYERIGNSILVAEAKSLKEETGLSSYVVSLKFADANDVKAALRGLTDQIEIDRGGNRLIIVTSPRIISEIESIVSELDRPARQVMLEARIVEVSTDDTKKLGIDWDLLNRQGVLIVEGNPAPSASGALPDQLPFLPPNMNGNIPGIHTLSRQAKAFQVAIDLLIREGNARVLANPKLATLNGKEATMLVGQRIPFLVSGTVFAGGGAAPVQSVQREEVGIKLSITPLINADGYITTIIKPEVSSVTGFKGNNADLPIIATRQASTTVRLKDGSSVIIGGLLSEEKTVSITRVPLLGSIPLLGLLFQHQSITTTKKDLVIEVTPRILPEQP